MNISEIAKLAGVSKAAVSRYYNNGYLSDDKKNAIEKVILETGYEPNAQAQTLRTRKTRQIGVVLPKLSSESCARVVEGIGNVLNEHNYLMMLASTDNDTEKEIEYLNLFRQHRVEGVIFLATLMTPSLRELLSNMHIPIVIVGQNFEGFDCVYHDDEGAAFSLTSLMLSKGRRKPGFIGVTAKDKAAGLARQNGYFKAIKEYGIKPDTSYMETSLFKMESGYEKARLLLSRHSDIDCLFCATDSIAAGAMKYCLEVGIEIPKDLMLCGIGDSSLCLVTSTTITSAHLHYKTSGEDAARIMASLLSKKSVGKKSLCLDYDILERDSTLKSAKKL